MKKVTTNMTRRFCTQNIQWLHYVNDCYVSKYKTKKSYPILGHLDFYTWSRNQAFHYAEKALKEFGIESRRFSCEITVDVFTYKLLVYMDIYTGEWYIRFVSCDDVFYEVIYRNIPFVEQTTIEYKGVINIEAIKAAANAHVSKYLFNDGVFRTLQTTRLWSKKQVIAWYKNYITEKLIAYDESTITKWILRHFKLDISEVSFNVGVAWAKRLGKQDRVSVLRKLNAYSLLDYFDGDIDDLENDFYDKLNDYPNNTIVI